MILATDFSIPLPKDRFLVIESDWADTPNNYLDYHMMDVRVASTPRGVARGDSAGTRSVLVSHSTIGLEPEIPIHRIVILGSKTAGEVDQVDYDRALIFHDEAGPRFSLATYQSIRGGLEFSKDPRVIENLNETCFVRHSIESLPAELEALGRRPSKARGGDR